MSGYGGGCPECQRCTAEDCDEVAACHSEPGPHADVCEAHRIARDLRAALDRFDGDPFHNPDGDTSDPLHELAAESRAVTDRFWATVGDRNTETTKGDT